MTIKLELFRENFIDLIENDLLVVSHKDDGSFAQVDVSVKIRNCFGIGYYSKKDCKSKDFQYFSCFILDISSKMYQTTNWSLNFI